jgi:hypothetical protein
VITPSRVSIANKLRFNINFSFYLFDGQIYDIPQNESKTFEMNPGIFNYCLLNFES